MFKSSRRITLVAAMVVCAVAMFAAVSHASRSWGGYHWARTANPFTLKVGNNVTSNWTTQFNTALADWSNSSVMNLTAIVGSGGRNCKMVAGTVQVCNRTYGNNGWLGLASINITGGTHITQGSAKMNDTYFNTATYNNPNEKLHVMCQEIGHTFGLGHTSEDGSSQNTCMDYFSNTGANAGSTLSTHPNSHDYAQLESIYAHLDSFTTIGASVNQSANAADDSNDSNNWGQLTSQSRNGRSSTYERGNSDGSKTVTHVYWTLEAAERCPQCDHRYDR
jgi:hypothetical protein